MFTPTSDLADAAALTTRPSMALSVRNARLFAGTIILLFLLLGIGYSLVVPPFETPDEIYHYAFARHLAQGNALPVQSDDVKGPWEQEGSQAPLYYMLVGWLTSGIDQNDFAAISTLNPRANIGDPLFPGNKNRMLYSAVAYPLQGANLALHIGRWCSLLLGALTLWLTYLTARLAFPRACALPLFTLLVVASIPQFIFISASLSNDNLIITASAAVVYWLARLLAKPTAVPPVQGKIDQLYLWEWLMLGLLLGIAALSKLQGLGLFVLSALAVLLLAWTRRDGWLPLRAFLPVALPAVVLAGWWYWRNYTLYGDWSGVSHLLANNGLRSHPLTLASFWQEFRGLRYSFWGLFGWFNLLLPTWIYTLLDIVTIGAAAGLVFALRRRVRTIFVTSYGRVRLLVLLWAALSIVLIFYWISQANGSQGRLLFPAINAFAILLSLGLNVWLRRLSTRWRLTAFLALPAFLFACSLFVLTVLLPASYAAPKPVTSIPATAKTVDVIYGDQDKIRLLALEIPPTRFKPGDYVPVTLYLRADIKIKDDYQVFIQLLDDQRSEVGNLTTHTGWGRNPTRLWQAGAIYADTYPVLIEGAIDEHSPLLAQVYIGFVDPKTEQSGHLPIPAHTQAGAKIDPPFLGQITISPAQWPQLDHPGAQIVGTQFGQVIQLSQYDQPQEITATTQSTLPVTLLWDAIGTPATDYTAFVHLRRADGKPVAGVDRAPAADRFPTHFWRAGDRILSDYTLSLPQGLPVGVYDIWVGLYESNSGGALRLPVTEKAGRTTGDGEVWLGKVTVH
ncbi:MAG: DUF2142 domain-containing protein [Chloroflexi bacterium]|nr:DUF2142 domain-containing protein [Chloroflexota bacterium]